MIKATINNKVVKAKHNQTILAVAKENGIYIPTLCYLKKYNEIGYCRLCVVEIKGNKNLISACNTILESGMEINTNSKKVLNSRRTTLKLLSANHRFDCFNCPREQQCNFYEQLKYHEIDDDEYETSSGRHLCFIKGNAVTQDLSKCILCKRCVSVCQTQGGANVIKFNDDVGYRPRVSPIDKVSFDKTGCTSCGACIRTCPTGTLQITSSKEQLENFVQSDNIVVAQISHYVYSALHEEIKKPFFQNNQEVVYSLLEQIGIDYYVDDNLGIDLLTHYQEEEFKDRLETNSNLPFITSDSPALTSYVEHYQPQYLTNLSTVKPAYQLQAEALKKIVAKEKEIDVSKVKVISITQCLSAKNQITSENSNVDLVLTTAELGKYAKRKKLSFTPVPLKKLKPLYQIDNLLSNSAIESIVYSNDQNEILNFKSVSKAYPSLKEATTTLFGKKIKILAVMGNGAFKEMVEFLAESNKKYHFIEARGCLGGCINGGGQPQNIKELEKVFAVREKNYQKLAVSRRNIKRNVDFKNKVKNLSLNYKTTFKEKDFIK